MISGSKLNGIVSPARHRLQRTRKILKPAVSISELQSAQFFHNIFLNSYIVAGWRAGGLAALTLISRISVTIEYIFMREKLSLISVSNVKKHEVNHEALFCYDEMLRLQFTTKLLSFSLCLFVHIYLRYMLNC